jgi:hypothetical protein
VLTGMLENVLQGHESDSEVLCAEWSNDGVLIASGGTDKAVRVWDALTASQVCVFVKNICVCVCVKRICVCVCAKHIYVCVCVKRICVLCVRTRLAGMCRRDAWLYMYGYI